MLPLTAIAPTFATAGLMPRMDMVAGGDVTAALQRAGLGQMDGSTFPIPDLKGPLPSDRAFGVTPGQSSGESFGNVLGRMVQDVNSRQVAAAETVRDLQSGGNVSLHQAVIAMEEANVSFQLMVEVRNKLLEAYQELMRMQV